MATPSTSWPLNRRATPVRVLLRRLFHRGGVQVNSPTAVLAGTASGWTWAMLETSIFCVAAMAFGLWLEPSDPFGLRAQFGWMWLVPALLAMRYGTGIGIVAVLTLMVGWFALPQLHLQLYDPLAAFPEQYFLGGLALVLICGQFSDVWNVRNRRLHTVNAYLDERLNTLTKNHFLLRLSHERLEQDLLAKPLTLRETLQRLRNCSSTDEMDPIGRLAGVEDFIQLLGQSCQLETAAVHALDVHGRPQLLANATLGAPGALDMNDPLLHYSLEHGILAHVQTDASPQEARNSGRYLICAPLLPSRGAAVGVLVVEKLPFFALNDDLLTLLSVLTGYYADGIQAAQLVSQVQSVVPDCPSELALELVRLHRIRAEVGIESAMVALVFDQSDIAQDIYEQVRHTRRGVDIAWELSTPRHTAIITLLPLAGSAAVEGYLHRIESAIMTQHGVDFLSGHVVLHVEHLDDGTPAARLIHLVERCAL